MLTVEAMMEDGVIWVEFIKNGICVCLVACCENHYFPFFGYPFEEAFGEEPAYGNIVDAIAVAENIKCQSDRAKTVEAYRSMAAIFNEFLVKQEWTDMAIGSFQRKHVLAFLDYAVFTRKGG